LTLLGFGDILTLGNRDGAGARVEEEAQPWMVICLAGPTLSDISSL
jgi:hypothetical protein